MLQTIKLTSTPPRPSAPSLPPLVPSTMRAARCTGYGGPEVLEVIEVSTPDPGPDELLVRVHASAATTADSMMRAGVPRFARLFLGLRRPKNPMIGTGFSGEVVKVGERVHKFAVGDRVHGESGLNFGANAEYVCLAEDSVIAKVPTGLSHAEAAPIADGALTSLNFLTFVAEVGPGSRVLIVGASGSLGTAAVQLAKHLGAEVTGVCSSMNVDTVRKLGADAVLDYNNQDFTAARGRYDVVFDTVGKSSFSASRGCLAKGGVYMSAVLSLRLLWDMLRTAKWSQKKARFSATGLRKPSDLRELLAKLAPLFERGILQTHLDRSYMLDQIEAAHHYIDTGRKVGNVTLAVGTD